MDANGQSREPEGSASPDLPPVPLGDLERAAAIARGVRSGRPGDRRATLEQLLAAFGEPEATPRALRRIEAALSRAGVQTKPPLQDAVEDFPVMLSLGPAPRGPMGRPLVLVAASLIGLVLLVTLGRSLGGDEEPGVTLPAETTATETTATATTATSATATTTPVTTTTTAPAATTSTATTATVPAEASGGVRLTLDPKRPGALCVVDEHGRVLFDGTLRRRRTFEAGRLRAQVEPPADALAHGRTQHLPGNRIVVVGATRLKVLRKGRTYCEG